MGVANKKDILKKVVKTPRTGGEIAKLLRYPDYRSCSRVLGEAVKSGEIKHGTKGSKTGYYRD